MKPKILVIDDDAGAMTALERHLSEAGFIFVGASEGTQALRLAHEEHPDLIVLNLMLPGMDGFDVYRHLRRDPTTASVPVIFVSSRDDELDGIVCFELGADDYVPKPVSGRELVLRIRRSLERVRVRSFPSPVTIGTITIDFLQRDVYINGQRLLLTAKEFKLLQKLASHSGSLYTREKLLREVWDSGVGLGSRTVDTHIRRLREKMGRGALHIQTVRGRGYRFVPTF